MGAPSHRLHFSAKFLLGSIEIISYEQASLQLPQPVHFSFWTTHAPVETNTIAPSGQASAQGAGLHW